MKPIQEIMGWTQDWPSTFKVWFDADGVKRQHDPTPTIEEMLAWINAHSYRYELGKWDNTVWTMRIQHGDRAWSWLSNQALSRLLDEAIRFLYLRGKK